MKIWFDADNAPHVLILRPLASALLQSGHEVHFTARDRASTCELMDLYGLPYTRIAGKYGAGSLGKVAGTLARSVALARAMHNWGANVSFGHGSRALPIASRLIGVPTVTMYDYEWVNPIIFNLCCRSILLPDAIDPPRCREAGIANGKVRRFPGYKEELYLAARPFDPAVTASLGLRDDRVRVLVRPPATTAHYHNPEAEAILDELLTLLAESPEVQLVYLARDREQLAFLERRPVPGAVIPRQVYDGPTLVAEMDLVVGGGGTMTREAAILGVPSCSFFRGRAGRVDEALERTGRLTMLRSVADVRAKVRPRKKTARVVPRENAALVPTIVSAILEAAKRKGRDAAARSGRL